MAHEPTVEEALREIGIIILNQGEDEDGNPCYLYLAVRGDKLEAYNRLFSSPDGASIEEMEQVGTVLFSGEGEPSEEVKRHMEEEYGFDHNSGQMVQKVAR